MEKNNREEREITFMLYNYPNLNQIIENRKQELIDEINVGSEAWKRSKSSMNGYTLEDVIERIDDDYQLNRLKNWSIALDKLLIDISGNDLLYNFFDNKYNQKKSSWEILSKLHIDLDKYKHLDSKLKEHVYSLFERENKYSY